MQKSVNSFLAMGFAAVLLAACGDDSDTMTEPTDSTAYPDMSSDSTPDAGMEAGGRTDEGSGAAMDEDSDAMMDDSAEPGMDSGMDSGMDEAPATIATATYSCPDGTMVTAEFKQGPDEAIVTVGDADPMTLPIAMSGSGARYADADEANVFWEHQGEASVTLADGTSLEGCAKTE